VWAEFSGGYKIGERRSRNHWFYVDGKRIKDRILGWEYITVPNGLKDAVHGVKVQMK
jgi:hypothetical protein